MRIFGSCLAHITRFAGKLAGNPTIWQVHFQALPHVRLPSQVWSSSSDSSLLSSFEKKGQQKVVLSTDALPCAINDEGLRQFRVKRYATWQPLGLSAQVGVVIHAEGFSCFVNLSTSSCRRAFSSVVYTTIFFPTVGLLVRKEFRAKGVVRVSRLRALKGSYASA